MNPYELLSGTDGEGDLSNPSKVILIEKDSEFGKAATEFLSMDKGRQERVLGYMKSLQELKDIE